MSLTAIIAIVGEVSVLIGTLTPIVLHMKKLANGAKCQLRSDMLRIYYANCDDKTIKQFEYENFSMLYDAYKALKGNSFIDKVWREVQTWTIESRKDDFE
jgi:hypothetical protein